MTAGYLGGSQRNDDELAREQVEHTAENERDECTAHDDDVVRHAEIRGREVHEENRRVNSARSTLQLRLLRVRFELSTTSTSTSGVPGHGLSRKTAAGTEWYEYGRWEVPASLRVRGVFRVAQEWFHYLHAQLNSAIRRHSYKRL